MNTDVIKIHSDLKGKDKVLKTADQFALYNDLTGKDAMYIRLLTEETVCMVHGILDDFEADFNMESEMTQKGLVCRIRLAAEKSVDMIQEDKLLSVASSGKNENAKGIVGKIRELFRTSMQTPAITADQAGLAAIDSWYAVGISHGSPADTNVWSLMAYRSYIEQTMEPDAQERDELEKSIIARIADDVKVWLKTNSTEIVVEKLFERP